VPEMSIAELRASMAEVAKHGDPGYYQRFMIQQKFSFPVACLVLVSVVWAYWVGRPSLHYYLQHSARRVVTTPVVLLGAFLPVLVVAASRRRAGDRTS